jgi:hypothetical protein
MARWSDVVYLGTPVEVVTNGEVITSYSLVKRFVNRLSIRQNEYYNAMNTGLKPELMFEIRTLEYGGQTTLKHNNIDYQIMRTYDKGEFTELIVSRNLNG